MGKRVLVVGGVAGGMSTAARVRRLDEDAEVIVFEKGEHVSFSNCCLPYHLSDEIPCGDTLVLMSPKEIKEQYNLDVRVHHEVVKINREEKTIEVRDLQEDKTFTESYDKLVLSTGAKARKLPIEGIEIVPVFPLRNVANAKGIHDTIVNNNLKNIVVIGGGFIGVEAAENLRLRGCNVTIVELAEQILMTLDHDMVQIVQGEILNQGIDLHVGTSLEKIENNTAYLSNGKTAPCDLLVMSAGLIPESGLAEEAGLELTERKYIKVDQNYLTSDPDIYAIGDVIPVFYRISGVFAPLQLAGPAQKQARFVADHIYGKYTMNTGYLGSSAIKVFDYNAAATGLTVSMLERLGWPNYDYVYLIPKDSVGIMPSSRNQFLKVVFEIPTGRILGAQAVGKGDVVKRIDVIAAMLKFQPTLEDLKDLELCYAPPFNIARDSVNFAGYVGLNILHGVYKHVHVSDVRGLVEEGAYILDVREVHEYEKGHIKNAINLPLSELRERMEEIPKDKPVYLHCRSSQRSYNAIMALQHKGWNNLYNIDGSFLGLSHHEYFLDKTTGRESILTEYNFA